METKHPVAKERFNSAQEKMAEELQEQAVRDEINAEWSKSIIVDAFERVKKNESRIEELEKEYEQKEKEYEENGKKRETRDQMKAIAGEMGTLRSQNEQLDKNIASGKKDRRTLLRRAATYREKAQFVADIDSEKHVPAAETMEAEDKEAEEHMKKQRKVVEQVAKEKENETQ